MREKLNENPVMQIALVAVLVAVVGYFALTKLGGSSESEAAVGGTASAEASTAEGPVVGEEGGGSLETGTPVASTSAAAAPIGKKLPAEVDAAYAANQTIVLLVYRDGGIDDALVRQAAAGLDGMADVAFFSVPVENVADYSSITGPIGVDQAPALVVVRKRGMNDGGPAPATVDYGFRDATDIRQAVKDSNYTGPELSYAPN
jgi:hypothetical protein